MFAIKGDFFQISSNAGARALKRERPLLADTVEKVENRTTPKLSQMLAFGKLNRWDAP
jgi:hypothetical protein